MKKILLLSIVFISIFLGNNAFCKTYEFMFFYPGGAGSKVEAQPFLDAFTTYLSNKIKPDSLTGTYINDEATGISFMAVSKPAIAIISYPMWLKLKNKFPNAIEWFSTLPLPDGKNTEK